MSLLEAMHAESAESELIGNLRDYRALPARVGFGLGGVSHAEVVAKLQADPEQLIRSDRPDLYVTAGWLALELAAYSPVDSKQRDTFTGTAEHYFKRAASYHKSNDIDYRFDAINGRLGLIASNAYKGTIGDAVSDTAGLYVDVIEDLMRNKVIKKHGGTKRIGLLSELVVGTVFNSMDMLSLPASARHDKGLFVDRYSFLHDVNVWIVTPESLPARPNRYVQVKTGCSEKRYSPAITMLETSHTFDEPMRRIALAYIRYYNGRKLYRSDEAVIEQAKQQAIQVIAKTPDDDILEHPRELTPVKKARRPLIVTPRLPLD